MTRILSSAILVWALAAQSGRAPAPIALHPDNPHYFLWRGQADGPHHLGASTTAR